MERAGVPLRHRRRAPPASLRLALPGVGPGEADSIRSLPPRAPRSAPRARSPRSGPGGTPLPSPRRRLGARPASALRGLRDRPRPPGPRELQPWARGACPGSACSSCWSTPAPPSTAKPRKVRKEGRAAAGLPGLPGLRGPRAGARFPRGRAGAGKRAAVRAQHRARIRLGT